MATFSTLGDREVDALLAGTPVGDGDLAPIAEVVRSLRGLAEREPVPPMSDALRAQLAAAPVVPIGINRAMRTSFVKASAAAAVVAAVALMGVGAAENRLPSGVQDIVASTANLVGVHVPRSDQRHAPSSGFESGDGNESDGTPGYDGQTPGGATPADPGTPGDKTPATPATPPADSNGGRSADNGPDTENSPGTTATPRGQVNGTAPNGAPQKTGQ
jgi:hypothetical protein